MEIEFLLFPIQQLSKKLIRHLVNKVLLSGMLICIKSLIKLALGKNGKTCYFSTEKNPKTQKHLHCSRLLAKSPKSSRGVKIHEVREKTPT